MDSIEQKIFDWVKGKVDSGDYVVKEYWRGYWFVIEVKVPGRWKDRDQQVEVAEHSIAWKKSWCYKIKIENKDCKILWDKLLKQWLEAKQCEKITELQEIAREIGV